MVKRYLVDLTEEERAQLLSLTQAGKAAVRRVCRAQTLLLAADGHPDRVIAQMLHIGHATVERTRQRFVEEGFEAALSERPRPGSSPKLDGKQEAFLVALACSSPPEGRKCWTMQLLADRLVTRDIVDAISDETVRRTLKKGIKPWLTRSWCIPEVSGEFVWRMEEVLDLYAQPYDASAPVVCFDETNKQLKETRLPWPVQPGQPARYDYEYERNGVANLFMTFQPRTGWRQVAVTQHRAKPDFAGQMQQLVDVHFPTAIRIRVVLDNLNTHTKAALYEAFAPQEAQRIAERLEFHYTPKHGSWLNMAEIELSVLTKQCLDRRIPDAKVADARTKLKRLYPIPHSS